MCRRGAYKGPGPFGSSVATIARLAPVWCGVPEKWQLTYNVDGYLRREPVRPPSPTRRPSRVRTAFMAESCEATGARADEVRKARCVEGGVAWVDGRQALVIAGCWAGCGGGRTA